MYSWLNLRVLRLRKLAYLRFKISSYSAVLVIITLRLRQQAAQSKSKSRGPASDVYVLLGSVLGVRGWWLFPSDALFPSWGRPVCR